MVVLFSDAYNPTQDLIRLIFLNITMALYAKPFYQRQMRFVFGKLSSSQGVANYAKLAPKSCWGFC